MSEYGAFDFSKWECHIYVCVFVTVHNGIFILPFQGFTSHLRQSLNSRCWGVPNAPGVPPTGAKISGES